MFFFSLTLCLGAAAAPKIAIEPEELDMGRVKPGERAERLLTVRNLGDSPLVVERVITSCPCATVTPLHPATTTIKPGDSLDLTVSYTPEGRPGESGAAVAIYSNDPQMPAIVADLRVFIQVPVAIHPPGGVHWGLAPRGFPIDKKLMIGPGDIEKDIELLSVACSVPGVRIESEEVERTDRRFLRLTFALGDELPLGKLDAELIARVRVGEETVDLSIPFKGRVLGDQLLSPPAIVSPKTAYAQGQRISQISVRSSTGGPPPMILGTLAVGPVKASLDRAGEPDRQVIGVYAAENAGRGPQGATLWVMTSSKDEPIVGVPVYFRMGSPLACEPDRLVLHETGPEQKILVRHPAKGRVTITNLRFEEDSLRARIEQASQEAADQPAIVSVRPAARFDSNERSTKLIIETDAPGAERLTIPVLLLP